MCFGKPMTSEEHLKPLYIEYGSLNVDDSYLPTYIPENLPHHIDSVYLLKYFDITHETPILGFVYESSYEKIIVYTSEEAELFSEENNLSSEEDPFASSEEDPFASEEESLASEQHSFDDSPLSDQDIFFEGSSFEEQLIVPLSLEKIEQPVVKDTFYDDPLSNDPFYDSFYENTYVDDSYSDDPLSDEEDPSDSHQ